MTKQELTTITQIKKAFAAHATAANNAKRFFKTSVGDYAEHDQFIGVPVPQLRAIAKQFATSSLPVLQALLNSSFNEERLLALFILTNQYQRGSIEKKEELHQFYMNNLQHVNNWNLVDSSAHLILGAHLYDKDRTPLLTLAKSKSLWDRRIAIVATWYFIRNNDLTWTFTIAELLFNDTHDLIHKAVGWMLREAGKRDEQALLIFLHKHAAHMPRTMLRYALERFPKEQRLQLLGKK